MTRALMLLLLVLAAPLAWAECDQNCQAQRDWQRSQDRHQRELDNRLDREERYREHLNRESRERYESKPDTTINIYPDDDDD
jgi:hypothetical protein